LHAEDFVFYREQIGEHGTVTIFGVR